MSEQLADVISLQSFRTRRATELRKQERAAAGGQEDILSFLLGMDVEPVDDAALKEEPVSLLAQDLMERLVELGAVQREDLDDEVAYDWGDTHISLDLFVLAKLMQRIE